MSPFRTVQEHAARKRQHNQGVAPQDRLAWHGSVEVFTPEQFPENVRKLAPANAVRARLYRGLTGAERDFAWIFETPDTP